MKTYFFKISMLYSCKNKLHNEVQEYIKKWDGTLINGDEALKSFRNILRNAVVDFNRKHHRCHPTEIDFLEFETSENLQYLTISGNFSANIFLVKQVL